MRETLLRLPLYVLIVVAIVFFLLINYEELSCPNG